MSDQSKGVSTLMRLAAANIRNELANSEDMRADLDTTLEGLPVHLLEQVLVSDEITYPVLRALLSRHKGDSRAFSEW